MSIVNSKEINDKIASLPLREELSKELQRQEDIAAINDYALINPDKVFNDDFREQRKYLTEETWRAVILANPNMLDSASPKWRKIPNYDIVNKYQGQAFSGEVRKAINEDGVKLAGLAAAVPGAIIGGGALAKPVLSLMFYHPGTFLAETVGGTIGGLAGGAATDAITRGVSDYDSFANMVASNSTIPELYAEMLNPGMLLGGLAGGIGGNVLYNNVVKPTAQRAALPYLMAMQLNKNVRNANLGATVFDDAVLLGKVGWGPKLNVVFKHGSENPDLQTFIPYETWDVKLAGASPYKYFVTEHGSSHNMMDDRPFLYVGLFDLEKPIVLIGEFNIDGAKNATRNQLVQEARNRGADSYYMKDIYDNKANNQNVIIKFIDNQGETPYMGLTSKPSTLTEAERLGIPKGERNQLDRMQKEALEDLFLYKNSGQYRQIPNITEEGITWGSATNGMSPLLQASNMPGARIKGDGDYTFVRFPYKQHQISYYPQNNSFGAAATSSLKGGEFGELTVRPTSTKSKVADRKLILTSPRADAIGIGTAGEGSLNINNYSDVIDKNAVKSFSLVVSETSRPGTYYSGDNGLQPLGAELIRRFNLLGLPKYSIDNNGTKTIIGRESWDDIINKLLMSRPKSSFNDGLSTDSYMYLLKQGNRPGNSLRFGETPFEIFNDQGVKNKHIYDLWKKAKLGEISNDEFIKIFNEWVAPYNGMPAYVNHKGKLVIPHPYVYTKKQGGTINYLNLFK